jgi:hypothetical protein
MMLPEPHWNGGTEPELIGHRTFATTKGKEFHQGGPPTPPRKDIIKEE